MKKEDRERIREEVIEQCNNEAKKGILDRTTYSDRAIDLAITKGAEFGEKNIEEFEQEFIKGLKDFMLSKESQKELMEKLRPYFIKFAKKIFDEIEKKLELSSFDPLDPDNTEVLRISGAEWRELKKKFIVSQESPTDRDKQ